MADKASREERKAFQAKFLAQLPPRIRFSEASRKEFTDVTKALDHIEFMMSLMENHPLYPLHGVTFGSDTLDFRRALAYEMVLRQLGHTRSLVTNTNIRNRPGMGTSLRCMLEMHVFAEYLLKDNRTEDWHFLEKLYHGRALTSGGWYDIEREWEKEASGPMPEDAKDLIRALINLPRVGKIVRTVHDTDGGSAYLYSLYSEFVHPAFSRPRDDSEAAMGIDGIFTFGTSQFYGALLDSQEPAELLGRDIKTGSVVLQFFWPRLLQIDPLFDEKHRDSVQNKLKEHGVVPINQPGQDE